MLGLCYGKTDFPVEFSCKFRRKFGWTGLLDDDWMMTIKYAAKLSARKGKTKNRFSTRQ